MVGGLVSNTGFPYVFDVHTVAETATFIASAKAVGLSDVERQAVVWSVVTDPMKGVVVRGTGGIRKFRVGKDNRGKSGGLRVFSFHSGPERPVYLLAVLSKTDADNLTKAERNALAILAASLKR